MKIVAIGASLGGLRAVQMTLADLPAQLTGIILIVQHRSADSDGTLAELLQGGVRVPVHEAEDKMRLTPGCIYLAPPDYHLLVDEQRLALSTEPPVNYARPSIDVLFEAVAAAYGPAVVGVLLTGANDDGARGLAAIKRRGGLTIAQDPRTAEAPAMPRAAIESKAADYILPLEEMGALVARLANH